MILITGAAGKTGRAVLRALITRGETVRALVHRPEQVQVVEALGAHEAVVGDMASRSMIDRALRGTRAVYHICPNVSPDELPIGETVIAAACSAGVEHFVFHSVLHPQTEAMPHHWMKLRVEERLLESGLPFSILQPAAYMQNILAHWQKINEEGIYPVPYAASTRLSLVDLDDVAQAAALVLTEPGHAGATYQLVGTGVITQRQLADILSQRLGRPVRVKVLPLKTWQRGSGASGLGDYQVEALTRMFRYYDRHGFSGNPHILSWLLNRPPTTIEDFIDRVVQ